MKNGLRDEIKRHLFHGRVSIVHISKRATVLTHNNCHSAAFVLFKLNNEVKKQAVHLALQNLSAFLILFTLGRGGSFLLRYHGVYTVRTL